MCIPKPLIFIIFLVACSLAQAKPSDRFYQIDLIVFTHQNTDKYHTELSLNNSSAESSHTKAYTLSPRISSAKTAYHLLPASTSQLGEEYWALKHKPEYQVLLHYSWLQPLNNQHAIELPSITRDNWQVSGFMRIRRSNYYLLDTTLSFLSLNNQTSFVMTQKQRLKGSTTYYLDHPQVGILIKVHQLT